MRRGRVIAQLEPAIATSDAQAKALLRRHRIDRAWTRELNALRNDLTVEERF